MTILVIVNPVSGRQVCRNELPTRAMAVRCLRMDTARGHAGYIIHRGKVSHVTGCKVLSRDIPSV